MVSRCFGVLLVTIFFVTLLPFERVYCIPEVPVGQVPVPTQMPVATAAQNSTGNQIVTILPNNNATKISLEGNSSENTSVNNNQHAISTVAPSTVAVKTQEADGKTEAGVSTASSTMPATVKTLEKNDPKVTPAPSAVLEPGKEEKSQILDTKSETDVPKSVDKPTPVNSQGTREINCTAVDGKCSDTIPEKVNTSVTEKPTEKATEKATEKTTEKVPEKVTDKVPEVESPKVPAKIPGNAATNLQMNLVALLPILLVLLKFY